MQLHLDNVSPNVIAALPQTPIGPNIANNINMASTSNTRSGHVVPGIADNGCLKSRAGKTDEW
jgi:3,4-dihydroxy-2-butanone 4-phosphate synthase